MGRSRIACAVVLALAATAGAQPKPTDKQKQEAGELVKSAIAKSQAGDHQAAIELYMNAYDIVPQPVLLSNIATEYQRMKKPVEALKHFCMYLDKEPAGDGASYAAAQAKVLAIELGNKNADEKTACKPAPVKPDTGTGTGAGPATGTGTGAAAGAGNGGSDVATKPNEEPAGTKPSGNKALRLAGVGTAAAGAVALGFGIYYGIHAQDISDFITHYVMNNPGKMWPNNITDLENEGKAAQTNQIVLDIVGPVAIVAGGVMFWLGRSHKAESNVTVAPLLTPSSTGLAVSGRF